MKTIRALFLLCSMLVSSASAQPLLNWFSNYSSQNCPSGIANAVIQTSDGNFVAVGYSRAYFDTAPWEHTKAFIVKVDTEGVELWSQVFAFPDLDACAWSVAETPDGGFIMGVSTNPFGNPEMQCYAIRLDNSGSSVWQRACGNAWQAVIVGVLPDSKYFLTSTDYATREIFLTKLNSNGEIDAHQVLSGTRTLHNACLTSDGGSIYVEDTYIPDSLQFYSALTKVDADLNVEWSRTYFNTSVSLRNALQLPDGYLVVGAIGTLAYVEKVNTDGDSVWAQTFGGAQRWSATSLVQVPDNQYVIVGEIFGGPWQMDSAAFAININGNGELNWSGIYGGYAPHIDPIGALDVASGPEGCLVMAGCDYSAVEPEFYLLMLGPQLAGVHQPKPLLPNSISLLAFPNPFNPATSISFSLSNACQVRVEVYDLVGRTVKTLTNQVMPAGQHHLTFDASNLPSGIYFARLQAGNSMRTQKMILLK